MMIHPATQQALKTLESWGCSIIYGESGRLACGDVGIGRLAEPSVVRGMVREYARTLAQTRRSGLIQGGRGEGSAGRPPRALVSGGAMSLPVDAVRSIVNTSSGRTAAATAAALLDAGWSVTYLAHHSASVADCQGVQLERYNTYDDFETALQRLLELEDFDLVVHAAAVSDYYLASGAMTTKQETRDGFSLSLHPTRKLLPLVKGMATSAGRKEPFVIGFKLTVHQSESEGCRRAASYFKDGRVDLVIWNDLDGVRGEQHAFTVLAMAKEASGDAVTPNALTRGETLTELAAEIVRLAELAIVTVPSGSGNTPA